MILISFITMYIFSFFLTQITLKAYQNCSKIETLDFPGKKLFGNFAKEFLQERKEKLEGIFQNNLSNKLV